MNKRRFLPLWLALLCAFLIIQNAAAMSSTNYRLDWFTPATSGGGGAMSSTNYAVNLTIGQTAIGSHSSTNFIAGLGYWYGVLQSRLYLPLILR
jgi:hypothetical protein